MKYHIYINKGNGWQLIKPKNKSYKEVKEFIRDVYELDERYEVTITYRKNNTDFVLCHFVNTLHDSYNVEMKLERKLK